jgi:histidine triad (HIT) family protein
LAFSAGENHDDNIFARIVRGEAPSINVYEDADAMAFMDAFPQAEGHVLVISKTSDARTILDIDETTLSRMIGVAKSVALAVHLALHPDGVMIVQLNGPAAGQTVDRFHIHVIPRWAGLPLKGPGQGKAVDLDQLRATADNIRQAFYV